MKQFNSSKDFFSFGKGFLFKKLPVCLLALMAGYSNPSSAQTEDTEDYTKNNIKLNVYSLPMKNLSLQYERGLGTRTSVALGVRFQPKGALPFQNTLKNIIKEEPEDSENAGLDFVKNAKMGNWAITPEFRFYLGKKPHNGFYFAPFLRVGGYSLDWMYKFTAEDGTITDIDLKGKMSTFGGGLMIGSQWHIGKHILIDWWILGPMYNSSKLTLDGNTDLSSLSYADQQELQKSLQDISFPGGSVNASVNDDGVKATGNFGIPGIRTGLCIGYTF